MPQPPPHRPAWWLDERATIGRENLDADHAARYDEKEDAGGPAEVAYLQSLGVGPGATVVDLGAGTGQFALAAAAAFGRVVAVDPSPVMRDRLRDRAAGLTPPPEIVDAGFLTYEHRGRPADVVYSRYALHHLPEAWKAVALRRIARMLRPGGMLRLWDVVYHFPVDEAEERFEAWCSSVPVSAPAGQWRRADIEDHVRDEHSTFSWLLEPMVEHAGFAVERADYGDDGFSARYVLVRR
jgi:ubiquinone/menaquinone biosynthesis C-methylase UbiE